MEENANITLNDIYKLLQSTNTNLSTKIDSVKQNCVKIDEKLSKELQEAQEQIRFLESENLSLRQKLRSIERKSLKYNLIVYGLAETGRNNNLDTRKQIEALFLDKLEIDLDPYDIRNCYRLGQNTEKTRPILVEFLSNFTRSVILRNRTKLKGTKIFIQEDLTFEDRQERKILVEKLKEAKEKNIPAILKGNKLVIEGRTYTYSDFEKTDGEELDPPVEYRRTNSEPSTPTPKVLHYNPDVFALTKQPNISTENTAILTEIPKEPYNRTLGKILTVKRSSESSPSPKVLESDVKIPKKNPPRISKKT